MIEDQRKGLPSASGLQRLALCPGSWNAAKDIPEETSPDAERGTRLHKHMELGTTPEDPEEADAVQWCREQVDRLWLDLNLTALFEQDITEQRYWAASGKWSGQLDRLRIAGPTALVVDYKYGFKPVDVFESEQMHALALLVFQQYPGVKKLGAAIVQPYPARKEPRLSLYYREDLPQLEAHTEGIVATAIAENAPLSPSEKACQYCKAKATCPAVQKQALTCVDVKEWSLCTPEYKLQLYKNAKLAEKLAKDIYARVKDDLLTGTPIPGLKLKDGNTRREVSDPASLFDLLQAKEFITAEGFTACCSVKIGELEKAAHKNIKAKRLSKNMDETKAILANLMAPYITTTKNQPSITEDIT